MEELLGGKIGKDCVSVVCKFLHKNDIDIVKKALDDKYEMDIDYPMWDITKNFNVFMNYVDWYVASGDDVQILADDLDNIINDKDISLRLKCRAIKYILEKNVVPFQAEYLFYKKAISELIVEFYGIEYLSQNFPNVIDKYIKYCKNKNLNNIDYLYNIGFRPIKSKTKLHELIVHEERPIWEWAIAHGFEMNYDTFYYVLTQKMDDDEKAEAIAWLLDHNCPYK